MTKKPVVLRIIGVLALYCAVFAALVVIQFAKKANFSRRIGNMVISGQYREFADREIPPGNGEQLLTGGALVFFGGLEFNLKNRDGPLFDDEGFVLIDTFGARSAAIPERVIWSGDSARFLLSGGTQIVFSALYSGSGQELWISAIFGGGVSGLEVPFKPRRSSIMRSPEDGRLTVLYENAHYRFADSDRGESGRLSLDGAHPSIHYQAASDQKFFNPGDFVIAQAKTAQTFDEALDRWKDTSFSYWSRTAPVQDDESTVIAYCAESLERGNYPPAAASISPEFLADSRRSYESSVYLGGTARALRSFTTAEQENLRRISRLADEKSPEFLKESHVFEFLLIRGYANYVDAGLDIVRSIDPAALTLDLIPGIFEGYMDLKQRRPQAENPFERLIEASCGLIASGIQKDSRDLSLVFSGGGAGSEFNLRLGKALRAWAENADSPDWAALGRSLMLSVLSLADDEGAAPAALVRFETGELGEAPEGRISAARLYQIINPGQYYPRTAEIDSGANGVWAWTAAPVVSVVNDSNTLDMLVTFPVEETHYMLIRGVRPISRVELFNRDWPPDTQFERYDSSGWLYYPDSRILILKMKHRDTAEQRVRVFYRGESSGRNESENTSRDEDEIS